MAASTLTINANTFRSEEEVAVDRRREMMAELSKLQAEVMGELVERQVTTVNLSHSLPTSSPNS
jgi:hypothetical protein